MLFKQTGFGLKVRVMKPTETTRRRGTRIEIVALVLIVLLAVGLIAYVEYFASSLHSVKVESVTPEGVEIQFSGVNMTISMVVNNPNSESGTLQQVTYSLFSESYHIGDGRVSISRNLPSQSNYTLLFPVGMGWGPASTTAQSYYVGGGSMNWMLNGTIISTFGARSFSTQFDYSGTFGF